MTLAKIILWIVGLLTFITMLISPAFIFEKLDSKETLNEYNYTSYYGGY